MSDLTSVLADFVRLFDELAMDYAVMGGLAVRVHGIPRPTFDLDFTVAINRQELPRFYERVTAAGYTIPEAYSTGWVDQVAGLPLIKVKFFVAGNSVDLDLFLAESPFQRELMKRRQRHVVDGQPTWVVSPEDLILLKLIAHRPRDFVDVADVLFAQGQLDEAYLRRWATELGVSPELESALAEQQTM